MVEIVLVGWREQVN